jgi:hypothetical protein
MSKCKKNVFLIFGYLLAIAILFLPCQKAFYDHMGDIKNPGNAFAFIPFYISKSIEYKKSKKWQSYWQPDIFRLFNAMKNWDSEFEHRETIDKFFNMISSTDMDEEQIKIMNKKFLDLIKSGELFEYEEDWKEFKTSLNRLKQEEFISKFGENIYYYRFNFEFFITEIIGIFLIGGFAYILFCVVLRKSEKRGEK